MRISAKRHIIADAEMQLRVDRSQAVAPPRPTDPDVAAAFDAAPPPVRRRLLELRRLILATAAATEGVGPLSETLKWGEPAYLTEATKSGTTLRLGWKPDVPQRCRLLVHCQTDLIEQFRARFGDELRTEGRRALVIDVAAPPPEEALAVCIELALTYRRRKRPAPSSRTRVQARAAPASVPRR